MALFSLDSRCERGRRWASLDLDGELSEFERVLLRAHLKLCADCREFQTTTAHVTASLRGAPLERLGRQIVLPSRRVVRAGAYRVGLAAAGVAVAIMSAFGATFVHNRPLVGDSRVPATQQYDVSSLPNADLRTARDIRRSVHGWETDMASGRGTRPT